MKDQGGGNPLSARYSRSDACRIICCAVIKTLNNLSWFYMDEVQVESESE